MKMKNNLQHKAYLSVFFVAVFTLLIAAAPTATAAPTNPNDITTLILSIDPEFPKADEDVTVTVVSYAIDLNRSILNWYVNDEKVLQGAAEKKLTVKSGSYGTKKTVRVQAISSDGRVSENSIYIAPTQINILWQADTYTPPFYKGRRLYSNNSDVFLTAIPNSTFAPNELIYTWKRDGDVIPDTGGLGKNTITLKGSIIMRERILSVDAVSLDGSYFAHTFIRLNQIYPKVLMYEDNPLYGVRFEQALGKQSTLAGDEIKINAYPLFYSTKSRLLNNVSYTWSVGSNKVNQAKDNSSVILKRDPTAKTVNVILETKSKDTNKLFQLAKTTATINFSPK